MRWPCSICSAEKELRDAVNQKIRDGASYRSIKRTCNFSLSTIHRHAKKHLPAAALARHKANSKTQRLITRWPNGSMTIQHDPANPDRNGQPLASVELQRDDVVVSVQLTRAKIGNPAALLKNPEWLAMLEREQVEVTTVAVTIEQNSPQEAVGQIESTTEPLPSDPPETIAPAPSLQQQPQSETSSQCVHQFANVSNSKRCIHCGFQPPAPTTIGVGFADLERKKDSFGRGRFGRF